MKHVFVFFILFFALQYALAQKQLVPNAAFQITTDEVAMAKAMKKLGYKNVMLLSADALIKVASKLNKEAPLQTKINGWVLWQDLQEASTQTRKPHKITPEGLHIMLDLADSYYLGTYLTEKMQAGKTYKIVLQFPHIASSQDLPTNRLPSLGYRFLSNSPANTPENILPTETYQFKQDTEGKEFAKRRAVIEKYQREYGGNFDTKEWLAFQGKKDKKDNYAQLSFTYKAQGGEQYLVLGNFKAAKQSLKNPFLLTFYRLYVYEVDKFNTLGD